MSQKSNSSVDIVGTNRAENHTYIGGEWALATFNKATTAQYRGFCSAWVGQYVTAYGYTSGQRGGTVLKLNVNFTTGPSCMVQATYTSAGGDSGGGVFYSNSPVGLNRGHGTSGGVAVAYFTPASQYMGSSVY